MILWNRVLVLLTYIGCQLSFCGEYIKPAKTNSLPAPTSFKIGDTFCCIVHYYGIVMARRKLPKKRKWITLPVTAHAQWVKVSFGHGYWSVPWHRPRSLRRMRHTPKACDTSTIIDHRSRERARNECYHSLPIITRPDTSTIIDHAITSNKW